MQPGVGQRQVDVHQVYCHGLVTTGHTFLQWPRGTGFLYVPHQVANQLRLHHMDHHGNPVMAVPASSTSGSSEVAPLPAEDLIEIRPKPGASQFEFYESNIANKLGLGEAIIKQRLWDTDDNGGVQFETSLVPATSTLLDSSQMDAPDMVRVSLTYTNTVNDLDILCDKLESILQDI